MLTSGQNATLKAAMAADGTLNALPMNSDGDFARAAILNIAAVPDYWVWRTSVPKHEIVSKVSQDATSFIWAGNGFITRSPGELECWHEVFNSTLTCNPSLANVRQAFTDIFSGTGNAANNRTHLLAVSRRLATRAEKMFATGAGTTAAPSLMAFEGNLTYQDVEAARTS